MDEGFVCFRDMLEISAENLEIEQLRRIFRTIMLVTTLELGGFTITQLIMSVQQRFELSGWKLSPAFSAQNRLNS